MTKKVTNLILVNGR